MSYYFFRTVIMTNARFYDLIRSFFLSDAFSLQLNKGCLKFKQAKKAAEYCIFIGNFDLLNDKFLLNFYACKIGSKKKQHFCVINHFLVVKSFITSGNQELHE